QPLTANVEDVLEAFAVDAAADRIEHLLLNVLGVHLAVGSHASSQPDGEPAAAGPDVCHSGPLADTERVHHQFWFLPGVAIGSFEDAELFRREEPPGPVLGVERKARDGGKGGDRQQGGTARRHCLSPGTPGSVIACGDNTRSSRSAGMSPRSRTRSRIERFVATAALAISAVVA